MTFQQGLATLILCLSLSVSFAKEITVLTPWFDITPQIEFEDSTQVGQPVLKPNGDPLCQWYTFNVPDGLSEFLLKNALGGEYGADGLNSSNPIQITDSITTAFSELVLFTNENINPIFLASIPALSLPCKEVNLFARVIDWAPGDFQAFQSAGTTNDWNFNPGQPTITENMVKDELNDDRLPEPVADTYTKNGRTVDASTITQWFQPIVVDDTTNQACVALDFELKVQESNTGEIIEVTSKDDQCFFPIDDFNVGKPQNLLSDQNNTEAHCSVDNPRANYSFCMQISESFTYKKGQTFNFRGDDDLWVFIDRKLALDMGGAHSAAEGSIDLDDLDDFDLKEGTKYDFDLFFCERQAGGSSFKVESSLDFLPNERLRYEYKNGDDKETFTVQEDTKKVKRCDVEEIEITGSAIFKIYGGEFNGEDLAKTPVDGIELKEMDDNKDKFNEVAIDHDKLELEPGLYLIEMISTDDSSTVNHITFIVEASYDDLFDEAGHYYKDSDLDGILDEIHLKLKDGPVPPIVLPELEYAFEWVDKDGDEKEFVELPFNDHNLYDFNCTNQFCSFLFKDAPESFSMRTIVGDFNGTVTSKGDAEYKETINPDDSLPPLLLSADLNGNRLTVSVSEEINVDKIEEDNVLNLLRYKVGDDVIEVVASSEDWSSGNTYLEYEFDEKPPFGLGDSVQMFRSVGYIVDKPLNLAADNFVPILQELFPKTGHFFLDEDENGQMDKIVIQANGAIANAGDYELDFAWRDEGDRDFSEKLNFSKATFDATSEQFTFLMSDFAEDFTIYESLTSIDFLGDDLNAEILSEGSDKGIFIADSMKPVISGALLGEQSEKDILTIKFTEEIDVDKIDYAFEKQLLQFFGDGYSGLVKEALREQWSTDNTTLVYELTYDANEQRIRPKDFVAGIPAEGHIFDMVGNPVSETQEIIIGDKPILTDHSKIVTIGNDKEIDPDEKPYIWVKKGKTVEEVTQEQGELGILIEGAIIDIFLKEIEDFDALDPEDFKIEYQLRVYSSIGQFLMTENGEIPCADEENGMDNCLDAINAKNVFVKWNGLDYKGRKAGTGVYIFQARFNYFYGDKQKSTNDIIVKVGLQRNDVGFQIQ